MTSLYLFVANFIFIGLKAAQQRNVQHLLYGRVFIFSHIMALVEVYVIFAVADQGLVPSVVLPVGLGGGLGAITAMYLTRGYKHAESGESSK